MIRMISIMISLILIWDLIRAVELILIDTRAHNIDKWSHCSISHVLQ